MMQVTDIKNGNLYHHQALSLITPNRRGTLVPTAADAEFISLNTGNRKQIQADLLIQQWLESLHTPQTCRLTFVLGHADVKGNVRINWLVQ